MKADKLLSLVDRKMVIDFATEMVNTASPTGEEGNMARLLARKEVGLSPQLQNMEIRSDYRQPMCERSLTQSYPGR